jgi:hypothetical protein
MNYLGYIALGFTYVATHSLLRLPGKSLALGSFHTGVLCRVHPSCGM